MRTCAAAIQASDSQAPERPAPLAPGCPTIVHHRGGAIVPDGHLQPPTLNGSLVRWEPLSAAETAAAGSARASSAIHMHTAPRHHHGTCINISAVPVDRLLSRREIVECLSGLAIFVAGNSIARHWAFALSEVIEGATAYRATNGSRSHLWSTTYRKEEQARCGGALKPGQQIGPGGAGACQFRVGNQTTITYAAFQKLHSPPLKKVWDEARAPDIAVLHAGTDDLFNLDTRACWESIQDAELPALAEMLTRASRRTPHLYWRTSTRLCVEPTSPMREHNCFIELSNNLIMNGLCHRHAVPGLRVIDGWAWTDGRCADYEDAIHHQKLTLLHVHALLADVCTRAGAGGRPQKEVDNSASGSRRRGIFG